jgi:hypothetical protein
MWRTAGLTTARLVVRDDLMRVYVIRMSELAAELPLEVGKVASLGGTPDA